MKKFLLSLALVPLVGLGLLLTQCTGKSQDTGMITCSIPAREAGQTDALQLRCAPIDTVRIGFIGMGGRGRGALERFTYQEGVKIVAVCDLVPENIAKSQQILAERGFPAAEGYCGEEEWKKVCERDDIDLIYCCTDWVMHTPIGVYAMEHGKHVASEVPAALTVDECWQLVNTVEKTRRHFMMLENCCYDFFELATLNMAQKGLFGEIIHVEGAYIHDLRDLLFDDTTSYYKMWRLEYNAKHDGNPYPTHGLGPICQALDIHRGDKMEYLVSMSTDQFSLTPAAIKKHGPDSEFAKREYKKGDMNTTVVRTAKGKTILVQHNVSSPQPYSRIHLISGTKGFAQKWPCEVLAFDSLGHGALDEAQREKILAEYEHPISKFYGEKARQVGGHGGMDFIMDARLIYCLRNGLPLDQDVYDAAEWCSLVELTEISVNNGSRPVQVPDFTRGAWNKIDGFSWAMAETDK